MMTVDQQIVIRRATEDDLPEILSLQRECFRSEAELVGDPDIPPMVQTLDELSSEAATSVILVMTEDGIPIGSVRAHASDEDGTVHVGRLFVHPDSRCREYWTRLLSVIETECPGDVYRLFTSSLSLGNIALYERSGYKVERTTSTGNGYDMVHLVKEGTCLSR